MEYNCITCKWKQRDWNDSEGIHFNPISGFTNVQATAPWLYSFFYKEKKTVSTEGTICICLFQSKPFWMNFFVEYLFLDNISTFHSLIALGPIFSFKFSYHCRHI